ncbi:glycoside hydrolase family 65 protein [Mesobacillus subterraneus]|uniref:Glycoside hydrolase family 65 n=1 Tax=Mesobacillus subterraneus TaxID=285983 RepID=A0A0D6ZBP9_9BACI|nr:glycosyl hydrolase family 65 protein [Mesobacillus subterraneus]KIY22013.1 glycoside hydrolase family 65 [Mesobacillus subterraneus]
MTWTLTSNERTQDSLLLEESLYSLGNGYLGIRGNFEEGYGEGMESIRGAYQNAFHDIIEIPYGEKLFAFPETQQKLVNVIDSQTIQIFFGEEEERFSLFEGKVLSYNRQLHLDKGYADRVIHWQSPAGKEVKLTFRRLVSFFYRELFVIETMIEPVNFFGKVKILSSINGNIANYVNPNDPRVGSGHAKMLSVKETGISQEILYTLNETFVSKLQTSCVSTHHLSGAEGVPEFVKKDSGVEMVIDFQLSGPVKLTKWNVYTDNLRHEGNIVEQGMGIIQNLREKTFDQILELQTEYMEGFWEGSDIIIRGDDNLQEGIRFNLFQLLQSTGRDKYSNISAKGLSGEGYEGHYFWDTEIYILPVFMLSHPDLAKQLLRYRYSILDHARARAKEMGHKQGALFPWRTISGGESSSYFPAGTAQYHISADIAYSYVQYYLATEDRDFIMEYGAEVLFETARLWLEVGHYHEGLFKIDAVTGPDEYTCIINNNYYTNVMAKYNLQWAAKVYQMMLDKEPEQLAQLADRLKLSTAEVNSWEKAGQNIYLPYDKELKINPQDDSFLKKAVWDFDHTPKDHYPLLLHYHPLTLYRYQVCKQADTVLAHFLLEEEQDFETIKNSFSYYERITTHDSSLSSCIFSIMAAKIGDYKKAYEYFIETARLDLDNTHGNTKDGLHMANMGGTWMSIVYGFAGLRLKENGIVLNPSIPENWSQYGFKVKYKGMRLDILISQAGVKLELVAGEELTLYLNGEKITLRSGKEYVS